MATTDIALKFTEEKYATKNEVRNELKTPLVDAFWKNINDYRNQFYNALPLKTIDRAMFRYCRCHSIEENEKEIQRSLSKFETEFVSFLDNKNKLKSFTRKVKIHILKDIANIHSLKVDDNYLRMIVDNQITVNDPSLLILPRYLKAIEVAYNTTFTVFNVDSLAEIYATLVGQEDNLISFVRGNDETINKVLIDRIYDYAPVNILESLLNCLFNFVQNSSTNSITKASVAYYYICYIKPFEKYNEEMALLLAKIILANEVSGKSSFYFPYEDIYRLDISELKKLFIEVQKTTDTTYVISKAFEASNYALDYCFKLFDEINGCEIEEEYLESKIEEVKVENEVVETPPEAVETKVSTEEVKQNVNVAAPVETEIKVITEPKKDVLKPKKEKKVTVPSKMAVTFVTPRLSEEEALQMEEDLLESDPCLKRHQARFFVKHCTIGKRYTIQQYKKFTGCVYETARTSMDALVELGYYRQEMVKNKKVYTPIDRTNN